MKNKIVSALAIAALAASISTGASALTNTTRIRIPDPTIEWYTLLALNPRAELPRAAIPNYKSPYGIFQYRTYPFHFINATFDGGETVYSKLMCGNGKLVGWEQMGASDAYCFGVTKDNKVELIELLSGKELVESEDWPMSALRGHHYEDISLQKLKFKDVCFPYSGLTPDDCYYPARDFPKKGVFY